MATLFDRLRESYTQVPDRVAIQCMTTEDVESVTFRSLLQAAMGVAQDFNDADIRAGDAVVIILPHGRTLVDSFFGCMLCGAIPSILPFLTEKLDPARYAGSLTALINVSKPKAIVTSSAFESYVRHAVQDSGASVHVLLADDFRSGMRVAFEDLPGALRSADDIALLQHSSGTTGLQKGVALSHRSILKHIEVYARSIQMTSQDVVVSWLPLYHDMGLIAGFIMPILLQATLVLMSPLDWVKAPYKLFQTVTRYSGTLTWLPNFAYNFCAQKIRDRDLVDVDLSSWRAVINCSEPMRLESHLQFVARFKPYGLQEQALATCYAMAENVFAVTQSEIGCAVNVDVIDRRAFQEQRLARPSESGQAAVAVLSAGRPLDNAQIRVVDDTRTDLPDRSVGEIALKSDCMLTEYFRRKDLTENAFCDGWFMTGDLGYLADGELYIAGRKKEIIIVGGKNVYPQDLEQLACEVPGVHPGRVVAFGVFNEQLGTEDVAIVAEGDIDDPQGQPRLAQLVRREVNRGSDVAVRHVRIVPRGWVIKTSSGKHARDANRSKFIQEFLNRTDAGGPRMGGVEDRPKGIVD